MKKINFREFLVNFSVGRNGADELYKATAVLYVILAVANIFLRSVVLWLIVWAMFIWSLLRCLSRNITKRRKENEAYLKLTAPVRKKLSMTKTILTDKEHYYKKCSRCKAYLRLQRTAGEHGTVCPKCGYVMKFKIKK